jgi:ribosomal protein L24p/L26e, archaeal/eukaryotic
MNQNKVKVTLAKDLRKKLGIRQFPIITGDIVKVIKGTRRGEGGKVSQVDHKHALVVIEGINIAKADGKEKEFPVKPEKIAITKLELTMDERVARIREVAALKHVDVNKEELEEFSAKNEEPSEEPEATEIEPVSASETGEEHETEMDENPVEESTEDQVSDLEGDKVEDDEETQDEEELNKNDKQD